MKMKAAYATRMLIISSILALTPSMSVQALDRRAAAGIAVGLGMLGGMVAAQQRAQQPVYFQPLYIVRPHRIFRRFLANVFPRRPAVAPVSTVRVTTDVPYETRWYWNCGGQQSLSRIFARAERGFLKESFSTRFICGNPRHPVKTFTYLSPSGYIGSDKIEYVDNGRLSHVDMVQVGSFGQTSPIDTELYLNSNAQRDLIDLWNCEAIKLDMKAQHGFLSIRDNRAPDATCAQGWKFTKTIVYRSGQDFVGTDRVFIYSSARAPVEFTLHVSPSTPEPASPQNSSSPDEPSGSQQDAVITETDLSKALHSDAIPPEPAQPVPSSPKHKKAINALAAIAGAPQFDATMSFARPTPRRQQQLVTPNGPPPSAVAVAQPNGGNDKYSGTAAEFAAAIGRQGNGRCHMGTCDFFIIRSATLVGKVSDGSLFRVVTTAWGEEIDEPISKVEKKKWFNGQVGVGEETSMVFCSKTRPTVFKDFNVYHDHKWYTQSLRPGDANNITGLNERSYNLYYATCHNYITQSPDIGSLAGRLGYSFRLTPDDERFAEKMETLQPSDILAGR